MVDPTLEDIRRRDAVIVHMIDTERMTMTAVAKWFGISKQRVQQIYVKEKLLPLIESAEKRSKDVYDIRPTGNRQNYRVVKHGR